MCSEYGSEFLFVTYLRFTRESRVCTAVCLGVYRIRGFTRYRFVYTLTPFLTLLLLTRQLVLAVGRNPNTTGRTRPSQSHGLGATDSSVAVPHFSMGSRAVHHCDMLAFSQEI